MPPVKEDKKYCLRYECPLLGSVTIETFHNEFRQQALITDSCDDFNAYVRILKSNGYEYVPIAATKNFTR